MSNLLSLKNITKSYKQGNTTIKILKNIDFAISTKDFVAIIGASGSGKSTLLHIAGLLDKPDSGEVIYQNQALKKHQIRLQSIGFIYQYHHLLKDFSARENVALPMLLAGAKYSRALIKADELLEQLGLKDRIYNMPGELSGGEQQRVAIARSLINNPQIILADEPTGNLDPTTANIVFDLFLKVVKEYNTAVIMVTHNHQLASKMNKSYELTGGRLNRVKAQ